MNKPVRAAVAAGIIALGGLAFWAVQSHAALPPQYDRWNEFRAVLSDNSIPQKLGTYDLAERIERVGDLSYRVHGGKCFIAVKLSKRAPTGPQGQPMVGGSVISIAEVGEPTCK